MFAGLLCAVAAALLAGLAFPAGGATGQPCSTSGLTIRLARSFAGLSHVGGYITFTNRTWSPCRLSGWPTVTAVSASGTRSVALHSRETWWGPYKNLTRIPIVILHHGQSAYTVFAGDDAYGEGQTRCPPPYRTLRVTPPGNTRATVISAWIPYLGQYLPSCDRIVVSPVVPKNDLP